MEYNLEQEKKEILTRYRSLLRYARQNHISKEDEKRIRLAFDVALDAHKDMRRKSGEPYIYHPIEVAIIVTKEIGLRSTSIIAALLHDVVEDTDITLDDIERKFGRKVSLLVDGLTKIDSNVMKTNMDTTSMQAENFRKMLLTISDDPRVILIKIADRLHNMRTLDSLERDKRLKIKSETQYLYAPLAHRLGLYNIKSELEDLSLKHSNAKAYDEISNKIRLSEKGRQKFIKTFTKPILKDLKDKLSFANVEIKSRTKAISSIWSKMNSQGIPFEEVFDLFAIRIIVDVPREQEKVACWQIYSTVTDHYTPNTSRLRDWISTPRANGYESLHVTVMSKFGRWVEVQIRTKRMDDIAEKGLAAHWRYKDKKGDREQNLDMWIAQVRELLQNLDGTATEFLDDFRLNLFNKEVYVYTPKGDLKILPVGSTIIDFAYSVHSDIGARCMGGKVNGKLVPLSYALKTGDQIEIMTSNRLNAHEDWLKIAVTAKAKAKIKQHIRMDMDYYATEGREVVVRKLKQLKLEMDERVMERLLKYFNVKTEHEFFYLVGIKVIDHTQIKKFHDFVESSSKGEKPKLIDVSEIEDTKQIKKAIGKLHKGAEVLFIGDDLDVVDYSFAKCCNPIKGDEVFGYITQHEGIKIHRTSCPNAVSAMAQYGHRIIKAIWGVQVDVNFDVDLEVKGNDRMGMIKDITQIINRMKVNITNIHFETKEGQFIGRIGLSLSDRMEYDLMCERLSALEGIHTVNRLEGKPA